MLSAKALFLLALPALSLAKQKCDETAILTNVTYTARTGQTIYDIAAALDRSPCDVARVNRMADPNYITVNETILIPAYSCNPTDNTTCFLTPATNPAYCIFGGPHTYTTVLNDTANYVALNKYGITLEALRNGGPTAANLSDPNAILPPGSVLKLPICANSICTLKPVAFNYGVLKDLAKEYHTTVGQIEAINTNYYHSDSMTNGPTLVLPVKCHCPSGHNCTAVVT